MSDFLQQMAQSSAARAAAAAHSLRSADLDRPAYPLRLADFDVIAEIKNRSPAEGELAAGNRDDRVDRALAYAEAGAAAISVLTEPVQFDGELSHLEEVVSVLAASKIPVMRKDFLVDVVQILEAKAAGASGVLLIAAMLHDDRLKSMLDCAFEHDLFVLLESFDDVDLRRSTILLDQARYRQQAERKKFLIGVNTRDLRTLGVDPARLERFSENLPQGITCVAESGLHSAQDAARASRLGFGATLVGTALMRAEDPGQLVQAMLAAGRGEQA